MKEKNSLQHSVYIIYLYIYYVSTCGRRTESEPGAGRFGFTLHSFAEKYMWTTRTEHGSNLKQNDRKWLASALDGIYILQPIQVLLFFAYQTKVQLLNHKVSGCHVCVCVWSLSHLDQSHCGTRPISSYPPHSLSASVWPRIAACHWNSPEKILGVLFPDRN